VKDLHKLYSVEHMCVCVYLYGGYKGWRLW